MQNTNKAVREVHYRMARTALQHLLQEGKITPEEYEIAHRYAVEKYHPKQQIV